MIDRLAPLNLHSIDSWLKALFYFAVRHSKTPWLVWTRSFVIRLQLSILSVLCQIQKLNLEGQLVCICGCFKCVTDYTVLLPAVNRVTILGLHTEKASDKGLVQHKEAKIVVVIFIFLFLFITSCILNTQTQLLWWSGDILAQKLSRNSS